MRLDKASKQCSLIRQEELHEDWNGTDKRRRDFAIGSSIQQTVLRFQKSFTYIRMCSSLLIAIQASNLTIRAAHTDARESRRDRDPR
jgi:hypothetical protein